MMAITSPMNFSEVLKQELGGEILQQLRCGQITPQQALRKSGLDVKDFVSKAYMKTSDDRFIPIVSSDSSIPTQCSACMGVSDYSVTKSCDYCGTPLVLN